MPNKVIQVLDEGIETDKNHPSSDEDNPSSCLRFLPDGQAIEVPQAIIGSALSIYKDENIFLQKATFLSRSLDTTFVISEYPFTRPGYLPYMTSPLLFLCLSQLGYVLIAGFAYKCVSSTQVPPISIEDFNIARDEGNVLITRVDKLKFRKKILLSNSIKISISVRFIHHQKKNIIGRCFFYAAEQSISGQFDVVLSLREVH